MLKASYGSSRSTAVMDGPTYGVVEATVWLGKHGRDAPPPPIAITYSPICDRIEQALQHVPQGALASGVA